MICTCSITGLRRIVSHVAKNRFWICSFRCRSVSWSFFDKGGESEATQAHRLQNWRWNGQLSSTFYFAIPTLAWRTCCTDKIHNWFDKDYSTKFAPWLAFGCLSPRKIFEKIREYEKEKVVPWQLMAPALQIFWDLSNLARLQDRITWTWIIWHLIFQQTGI